MYSRFAIPVRPEEAQLRIVSDGDYDLMDSYYFSWNYRPVYYLTLGDQYGMGWGPALCVDCIAAGGHQNKPSFWDEDL